MRGADGKRGRGAWAAVWVLITSTIAGCQIDQPGVGEATEETGSFDDFSPRFAPDGRRIVFVRSTEDDADIFVAAPDGTEPQLLADLSPADFDPVVAPDGEHVVFSSSPNGFAQLFLVPLEGGEPSPLSGFRDGWATFPSWAPDGLRLVYSCGRPAFETADLCLLSRRGRFLGVVGGETPSRDWEPAWSPNGAMIAFASNRTGDSDIFVVDVASDDVRRLTDDPAHDADPAWSPNGSLLAFDSTRFGDPQVCVMPPSGDPVRCLGAGVQPSWSPDGSRIVFYRSTPDGDRIFVMNPDGSDPQRLTWRAGRSVVGAP